MYLNLIIGTLKPIMSNNISNFSMYCNEWKPPPPPSLQQDMKGVIDGSAHL